VELRAHADDSTVVALARNEANMLTERREVEPNATRLNTEEQELCSRATTWRAPAFVTLFTVV
jgi:hypothetical protein